MNTATTLDKSGERVRSMFAEIAGSYDRMNHLLSLNVDRYWRWRTVSLVPPQSALPILDVCTGTGDLAIAYWKASQGKVSVTASDFCREMLDIGEKKKLRLGAQEEITFVEADAQALPFLSDSYQIVSVAFGLRNVMDTDQGLREMHRVCAPDGKVAVLEFSKPEIQPFKALYGWYFRHILPRIGQWFARNSSQAYQYLPQSVGEFPSGGELAERMSQIGLRDVWYKPLTLGIATLYVGTK